MEWTHVGGSHVDDKGYHTEFLGILDVFFSIHQCGSEETIETKPEESHEERGWRDYWMLLPGLFSFGDLDRLVTSFLFFPFVACLTVRISCRQDAHASWLTRLLKLSANSIGRGKEEKMLEERLEAATMPWSSYGKKLIWKWSEFVERNCGCNSTSTMTSSK